MVAAVTDRLQHIVTGEVVTPFYAGTRNTYIVLLIDDLAQNICYLVRKRYLSCGIVGLIIPCIVGV